LTRDGPFAARTLSLAVAVAVVAALGAGGCGAEQASDPRIISSDPTLVALAAELLPDLAARSGLELREPVRL
jgi:hypothetical protein